MRDAEVNIWTREEATNRRQEILTLVDNEEKFRARGASFELDSEELVLYDELRMLEYLLSDPSTTA